MSCRGIEQVREAGRRKMKPFLWKDSEKQASPFLGPLLPEWTRDWTKKQTKHSDTNTEPYFKWNLCILFWCAKEQIHYVNTKKAFMAFIKYFSSIPANLKLHNRVYILYLLTNLNTPINQWEHMYMKYLSYFIIWNVSPGLWSRHPVEHSRNTASFQLDSHQACTYSCSKPMKRNKQLKCETQTCGPFSSSNSTAIMAAAPFSFTEQSFPCQKK